MLTFSTSGKRRTLAARFAYPMALLFLLAPLLGCSDSSPADLNQVYPATIQNVTPPTRVVSPSPSASNDEISVPAVPSPTVEAVQPTSAQGQSAPVATPIPTIEPLGQVDLFAAEHLPPAPDRDLFTLAYQLLLPPGHPQVSPMANAEPVSYDAGRVDEFYLVDLEGLEKYRSTFELRLVSPHAYWYIEDGIRVDQGELERAAAEFEAVIYPRVTDYFGTEWTPGVDNDPHLTILHGDIRGAGGYFSSTDEYPSAIRPHSNQREMIYINSSYLRIGSETYFRVLAHELNHAILWNHDSSEDTWVSEGLAELSVTVAGYPPDSIGRYLRSPFIPLVHWPLDDASIIAHYGGASLFMHYMYEHYSGEDGSLLSSLMSVPEDNVVGIDRYLGEAGYDANFRSVFRDWLAANFLDEEGSLYGYSDLDIQVRPSRRLTRPGNVDRDLAQYGTHYYELTSGLMEGPVQLKFEGAGENRLLPIDVPGNGCWWSNAGDSIMSSLTLEVDLSTADQPVLSYQVWYSIEEDWDYVYLQVSRDGGSHWEIIETELTSDSNPLEVAFGPGYTGKSRDWKTEAVDLTKYAGQQIMLRFQYVTDDALNDSGLCVRDLAITGQAVRSGDSDWVPNGFVFVDNRVPQEFMVQVLQKGSRNQVTQLPLSYVSPGVWQGELVVEPYEGLERTMVAVTALAPVTREKAGYHLAVNRTQ